jgi:hypothetical protein
MKPRYNGPMVVVSRTKGGSYVLAEMDGSVAQQKFGAFRVIPYFARKSVVLSRDIHHWIDISRDTLRRLENGPDESEKLRDFNFDEINLRGVEVDFDANDVDDA